MKKVLYLFVFLLSLFMLDNEVFAWSEYKIGREVEYNGMEFYVIKDSSSEEDSVRMLKAEPLTVEEITSYSVNNDIHILDASGYGAIPFDYYSTDYSTSIIKQVVDAWKNANVSAASEAGLITLDELRDNLGYEQDQICSDGNCNVINKKSENTPEWVYNNYYSYWTMTPYNDSTSLVWEVSRNGGVNKRNMSVISNPGGPVVRPVITLSKTSLGDIDESDTDNQSDIDGKSKDDDKQIIPDKKEDIKQTSTKVKVENTYLSQSIIIILSGFILSCASTIIYYIIKNKKEGK